MPTLRPCIKNNLQGFHESCQEQLMKMRMARARVAHYRLPSDVRDACKEDAKTLCPDQQGPMDKLACLRGSQESVSTPCQEAAERWVEEMEQREGQDFNKSFFFLYKK